MEAPRTMDSYVNENFYRIYQNQPFESIKEADVILISEAHNDHRYQQIYQNFINDFLPKNGVVLVEGHERNQLVENHQLHAHSWKISPDIEVQGWDDIEYMSKLNEIAPTAMKVLQKKHEQCYRMYVENDYSCLNAYLKEVLPLQRETDSQLPKILRISIEYFSRRQQALIKSIAHQLELGKTQVVAIGGYSHMNISPNGYKPEKLDDMLEKQRGDETPTPLTVLDMFPVLRDPAKKSTVNAMPEPEWRKEFTRVFKDKKVILLLDKPLIKNLDLIDEQDLFYVR